MQTLTVDQVGMVPGGTAIMINPSPETQAGLIGAFIGGMMGSVFPGIGTLIGAFVGSEVGMYAVDNAEYIVEHSGDMSHCPPCHGGTP